MFVIYFKNKVVLCYNKLNYYEPAVLILDEVPLKSVEFYSNQNKQIGCSCCLISDSVEPSSPAVINLLSQEVPHVKRISWASFQHMSNPPKLGLNCKYFAEIHTQ